MRVGAAHISIGDMHMWKPVPAFQSSVCVIERSTPMQEFTKRVQQIRMPSDDCIWICIPEHVEQAIERWQAMFEEAVPVARINGKLCIGVILGLFNFERDLQSISRVAAQTTPMQAMLTCLEWRSVNPAVKSLVINVVCPELLDLHTNLTGVVSYPVQLEGFSPAIELLRVDSTLDLPCDFEAFGMTGCKWIIDHIVAGNENSHIECALLGHTPMRMTVDGIGDSIFGKSAAGMSTLDMESGAGLIDTEYSIDIDDDDEEDDDDDDNQWLARAMEMTETLDSE